MARVQIEFDGDIEVAGVRYYAQSGRGRIIVEETDLDLLTRQRVTIVGPARGDGRPRGMKDRQVTETAEKASSKFNVQSSK